MFTCGNCNREFKSKRGLSMHVNKCTIQDTEEVIVVQEGKSIPYDTERQMRKLRDLYKSTYDAKSRHDIDVQIKRLTEG